MKPTETSMKQKRKEPEEPTVNQNKREEGLRTISSRSAISGIFHLFIELLCSFVKLQQSASSRNFCGYRSAEMHSGMYKNQSLVSFGVMLFMTFVNS